MNGSFSSLSMEAYSVANSLTSLHLNMMFVSSVVTLPVNHEHRSSVFSWERAQVHKSWNIQTVLNLRRNWQCVHLFIHLFIFFWLSAWICNRVRNEFAHIFSFFLHAASTYAALRGNRCSEVARKWSHDPLAAENRAARPRSRPCVPLLCSGLQATLSVPGLPSYRWKTHIACEAAAKNN